jgi:hypothetical protein
LLVEAGRIKDGTHLHFLPGGEAEQVALRSWLEADPRRQTASWVNDRARPLVWAADGKKYSATGLVQLMWSRSEWSGAPVAVQGPSRWRLQSGETLVELADAIQREDESSLVPEVGG